jgi:hypothetical protein
LDEAGGSGGAGGAFRGLTEAGERLAASGAFDRPDNRSSVHPLPPDGVVLRSPKPGARIQRVRP